VVRVFPNNLSPRRLAPMGVDFQPKFKHYRVQKKVSINPKPYAHFS